MGQTSLLHDWSSRQGCLCSSLLELLSITS